MRRLACIGLLFLAGCATPYSFARYDVRLASVERPADATQRWGASDVTRIEDGQAERYVFTDRLIRASWLITETRIAVRLTNQTAHSIRILWNEAAFVDENDVSHRVIYDGVRYIDRHAVLAPSVIVQGGHLDRFLLPASYVHQDRYGWIEDPILPSFLSYGSQRAEVPDLAKPYVGRALKVLLPIQIQETVNEYLFTFTVAGVRVVDGKRSMLR